MQAIELHVEIMFYPLKSNYVCSDARISFDEKKAKATVELNWDTTKAHILLILYIRRRMNQ